MSAAGCGSTDPCINAIFGPTAAEGYYSSATRAGFPDRAWAVLFFDGSVGDINKDAGLWVRAVRGGS